MPGPASALHLSTADDIWAQGQHIQGYTARGGTRTWLQSPLLTLQTSQDPGVWVPDPAHRVALAKTPDLTRD